MPSKDNSYKGYSSPKCTCNVHSTFLIHIPTRTCQFYMESYIPCHEMRCDSSCTMYPSPHRLPYTKLKPMCDKPSFRMTSYFLWVTDFWCLTAGFVNPDTFTAFHRWGLCLTIIGEIFTRWRIYPFLLILSIYFLYHFNQSCNSVGRCPIYRARLIKHQTQCQFTNHVLTPMKCDVSRAYAM